MGGTPPPDSSGNAPYQGLPRNTTGLINLPNVHVVGDMVISWIIVDVWKQARFVKISSTSLRHPLNSSNFCGMYIPWYCCYKQWPDPDLEIRHWQDTGRYRQVAVPDKTEYFIVDQVHILNRPNVRRYKPCSTKFYCFYYAMLR